jgi:ketosteroid isomerase-like protein
MQRFAFHIYCALIATVNAPAFAQTYPNTMQSVEEQRVLATEDEYVAAEVARDEAALRRLVDDRFVFNRSNGTTSGKEELIQAVLKMKMTGQTLRERSLLIEGDTALVFATAELRMSSSTGQESVSMLRYTATYVRRNGSWRMLALQMQPRGTK